MYRLNDNNTIIRLADSLTIPIDEKNSDYLEYLKWVNNGNTAEPYQPLVDSAEINKAKASKLLLETDWIYQPDVTDVSLTPHLTNKSDFESYRIQLRKIAVNPIEGNIDWPVKPNAIWNT